MADLPTLLFIPGAWHQPACYDKVINIIQDHQNLKCTTIRLPSTAGNPLATFKDDVDAAREAISNETTQGRNVVVIAHSYGGMVGNSAIKDFTAPQASTATQPQQPPTTGYVIGLILIASGFTLTGLAFMDPFFGHPPPFWRVNSATGYAELVASPRELFYHDLPAEEAETWGSRLSTQSLKALFEGGEYAYAGWRDVCVWYIGTVEDRGLPVFVQRMLVGMARGMNGSVEHRELRTSHSPFLSQPDATAMVIQEAVGVFSEQRGGLKGVAGYLTGGHGDVVAAAPKVSTILWRPLAHLVFGLPLAIGHILGKCVLLFGWGRRVWRSRSGACEV